MLQFARGGIKFVYYYGFYISMGVDGDSNFLFNVGLKLVEFSVGFGKLDYHFFIINIFPLLPLVMLRHAERNPVKDIAETFLTEDEPVQ